MGPSGLLLGPSRILIVPNELLLDSYWVLVEF